MRVVIAPDSFGGTLTPSQAAAAIEWGWQRERPDDELVLCPMSDGGEGLQDAILTAAPSAFRRVVSQDVADAAGLATTAELLLRHDGEIAVVESAQACGLARLPVERRDPRRTTTWGVGQLLELARSAGARRILVGLGGSATIDGGAGALSGLGFRLTVADGSGLKIGGEDLPRVTGAERTWVQDWGGVRVELLADVTTVLADAPRRFGPQKGADEAGVVHAEAGLAAWRRVAERELGASPSLATTPGSGAAGGLGYGLAAGLGATFVPGASTVAELVGLRAALDGARLVVTGEGRLDSTTADGKVVEEVTRLATSMGVPTAVVAGSLGAPGQARDPRHVDVAVSDGADGDPITDVAAAAAALARRVRVG